MLEIYIFIFQTNKNDKLYNNLFFEHEGKKNPKF